MDDADDSRVDRFQDGQTPSIAVAVNSRYGVCSCDGCLEVSRLNDMHLGDDSTPLCKAHHSTVLAFCPSDPKWLTVAAGTSVCNYDLETLASSWTLRASHRTVTALVWADSDYKRLAVGCIDGSVSVWAPPQVGTVRQDHPEMMFAVQHVPCHQVAWLYDSHETLAALHGDQILIWCLTVSERRPIIQIHSSMGPIRSMRLQPAESCSRVIAVVGHELQHYETKNPQESSNAAVDDSDEGDSALNATLLTVQSVSAPLAIIRFECPIAQIQWISSAVMMVRHGHQVSLLDLDNGVTVEERTIWSLTLPSSVAISSVEEVDGVLCLVAFEDGVFKIHELPKDAVDYMKRAGGPFDVSHATQWPTAPDVAESTYHHGLPTSAKSDSRQGNPNTTMRPIPIADNGEKLLSFATTSKQLQQRVQRESLPHTPSPRGASGSEELQTPPGERSMISSLELPNSNKAEGHGSPMPFLSPNIPARQSPQTVIAPLDESVLELPPLPDSLTAVRLHASSAAEDDDSDDETFVDGLQNSGTFLPGGINVPLPKACGALFAPNGQLLTFFPPKVQQVQARKREDSFVPLQTQMRTKKVDEGIKLFPSFGNLGGDAHLYMTDSDSVSSDEYAERIEAPALWPEFQLQASSFPSQQSWQAQISPVLPDGNRNQSRIKVNISVYDLEEVPVGGHGRRNLAEAYRLLRDDDELGADVCNHNAQAAKTAGLVDVAQVWCLLGMLIDDKVPLKALPSIPGDLDILVVANNATSKYREAEAEVRIRTMDHEGPFAHLRWGDHPFGRNWLIRSILGWAERSADVQHLACFTAVLASVDDHIGSAVPTSDEAFVYKLASHCLDYESSEFTLTQPPRRNSQPIPRLRSSTPITVTLLQESPVKARTSNASSRNASQPTTPYLDSASTTPPFALNALSRQDTRLSTSGSVSPETHRSSFSAAAKYYAQSITDRFASYGTYGTSPPMKKAGSSASPRDNELSTSLPGGSWAKSVSFAASSTAAINRGSQLSRSYDDHYSDDAYDSDRTVEDSSAPHTPRLMTGDVFITHKNHGQFDDEVSGGAKAPLLPDDIVEKAGFWIEYYAEQVRNWSLLMKAAELENIFGTMSGRKYTSKGASMVAHDGIKPVALPASSRAQICAICTTLLRSNELICPDCLHTSHLSCFAEYASLLDRKEVACPTGCGCSCSEIPYIIEEARMLAPRTRQTFKKKASFTDPMLWRRRNEGDTW